MKRLYSVFAVVCTVLALSSAPGSAASLNDGAVIALDGNFAAAGYQEDIAPDGIGPGELVGFAIYGRNFTQLRAISIELSWTGDAVLVTGGQGNMVSGTLISAAECTINGSPVSVAAEAKFFDTELAIGETIETGSYQNHYALAGGTASSSAQYRLLYVAVFRTSSDFSAGDLLEVTATVTLGDDDAAEYVPAPLVFRVNDEISAITLLQPQDGAEYISGDVCAITWDCSLVDAVNLAYQDTDGVWRVIADDVAEGQNAYAWTIPSGIDGDILVRLTAVDDPAVTAASGPITVTAADHFSLGMYNTGSTATVLIPKGNAPTVDGVPIDAGDEIAVFTPGDECAGYAVWDGANCAITVWGDDSTVDGTAGFMPGEPYRFMLWDMSESSECELDVTCAEGGIEYDANTVTVIDTASYISAITASISLAAGWNMISSDVIPENPAMGDVFGGVSERVVIVKNGRGEVYWPEYGVNQIGDWWIADGYQVRMNDTAMLQITGEAVDPDAVDYSLSAGWNLVSYLGADNAAPASAFASIQDKLVIAKNGFGDVYWPKHGIDQIGAMHRRSGYLLKLSNSLSGGIYRPAEITHFMPVQSSDNNATIMITAGSSPTVNGRLLAAGDEIGVFAPSGICIGAGVWNGENLAITVWGDDSHTDAQDGIGAGDPYGFRIWDAMATSEYHASASYQIGTGEYSSNAIVVLGSLAGDGNPADVKSDAPVQFELGQNHPNPFNPVTTIGFTIPGAAHVELTVYNSLGEKVAVLVDNMLDPGRHEVNWSGGRYASGVYFYRLNTDGFSDTGKMTLIK